MPYSKAYTKAFKELYGIVPRHYRKKFINNITLNEDKKEQLMSLDNNQKQLLQPLLEDIENTIYEDDGVKIKVEEKHIICSIQCDKYVNSTISHCNDEIVIDIASV